jgi:phosphoribosylformylglycinamidine synthase
VGLLSDYDRRAGFAAVKAGHVLLLIGESRGELGASLYLREVAGREDGAPPPVDLAAERRNGDFVRGLIVQGQVEAVHDLSDGGLIAAAAEMALASGVGVTLDEDTGLPIHAALFGEDQARYLLAVAPGAAAQIVHDAAAAGVTAAKVGSAGGVDVVVPDVLRLPLERLRQAHEGWLPAYMAGAPSQDS